MGRARLSVVCVLSLLLVLSIGMISANNTIILGKVYNSDFSNTVSGASVSIQCGSGSLSTTSENDGAYFVQFDTNVCGNATSVTVSASNGGLTGTDTGITHDCDGNGACDKGNPNTTIEFFALLNPALTTAIISSSNGGGSSGGYSPSNNFYLCGNGVCNTGETPSTCPQDCHAIQALNNENNSNVTELSTPTGGFLGITGGAIGSFVTSGPGIVIILIIVLTGLLIVFFSLKKKAR